MVWSDMISMSFFLTCNVKTWSYDSWYMVNTFKVKKLNFSLPNQIKRYAIFTFPNGRFNPLTLARRPISCEGNDYCLIFFQYNFWHFFFRQFFFSTIFDNFFASNCKYVLVRECLNLCLHFCVSVCEWHQRHNTKCNFCIHRYLCSIF